MRGRMTLLVPGGFLVNLIGEFALHDVCSNFWHSTSACLNAGASALKAMPTRLPSPCPPRIQPRIATGWLWQLNHFSRLQVEQSLILLDSYNYQVFQSGDLVFQG